MINKWGAFRAKLSFRLWVCWCILRGDVTGYSNDANKRKMEAIIEY